MTEPNAEDRAIKRERVLAVLESHGHRSTLVLRSQAAVAWYLDGARIHVSVADAPVAAVVVEPAGDYLLTGVNEEQRLADEELAQQIEIRALPWWQDLLSSSLRPAAGVVHERDVADELQAARAGLLPAETARYRALGSEAAAITTQVLQRATPDLTERELAGRLAGRLIGAGADPVVILVGGSSRARHRHPLPTDSLIGDRAMVVVCARRAGLIANLTRWVRFGRRTEQELDADFRIAQVEAATRTATTPGAMLGDILAETAKAYAANGFGDDEWTLHHQGGPTGYAGRDPRALPGGRQRVVAQQAFAWNPTALTAMSDGVLRGCKVEDTVIRTAGGFEILTVDPNWPTDEINGLHRPAVLEL